MRRKTARDILETLIEYNWLICGSLLFGVITLCGIFLIIAPHFFPPASYDSLQTKEVTISTFGQCISFRYYHSHDYIYTTDGEKYVVSGDYKREQLEELLTEGRTTTIKWYINRPFRTLLAEEICVDGECVVTYDNDLPVDWKIPLVIGICFVTIGIGGFFLLTFLLKDNRYR